MRNVSLLFLSLTFASCAFVPERSFMAEMEEDDTSFFQPQNDFPVVPGDSGKPWRTRKEWKSRTPRDGISDIRDREKRNYRSELSKLESQQSESDQEIYQKYKKEIGTVSERIFFLQIPSRQEKKEYLKAKGVVSQDLTPDAPVMVESAPIDSAWRSPASVLSLGMSKIDVSELWGKPERIDFAGNPSNENERWFYRRNGSTKYIYFESGKVGGWGSASR